MKWNKEKSMEIKKKREEKKRKEMRFSYELNQINVKCEVTWRRERTILYFFVMKLT